MIRKWNWSLSLFTLLTLFLGSCSPLMSAAYPNPPSPIPVVTPTHIPATPTLGPVTDLSMPTSKQAWMPVSSEQVKKNEEILTIARPLLEKARVVYITPGWLYARSKTESFRTETSTLPDGTPIPTKWEDESWTLINEDGLAMQSVSRQDTGDVRTSQISTFQDGVWKNLTNRTIHYEEKTYSIPLDSRFVKNAEDTKDFITLEYDDTEIIGAEKVAKFTLIGPTFASQSPISHIQKYYFSIETGLLLRIEEYRPSPEGELELTSRIDTEVIEKVEQPPDDIMEYFEHNTEREYCKFPDIQLSNTEIQNLSDDEIAEKFMKLFLDYFNVPQAPYWCRIDGYTIDKISYDDRILQLEPLGNIMRYVSFSIKLIQVPNDWMSWPGEIDEQNWLHTFAAVSVLHSKTGYTMKFAYP